MQAEGNRRSMNCHVRRGEKDKRKDHDGHIMRTGSDENFFLRISEFSRQFSAQKRENTKENSCI